MSEHPVKLTEIRKEDLLVLLKKSGSRKATAETIEADIAAGAPLNSDGTVNIIEYAAWLIKETNGI
jgi:regulator of PEP synthase PpsR (kinase-PPPase family)